MKLAALASMPAYVDHVRPIWRGLRPSERVPTSDRQDATMWLAASTRDLRVVHRDHAPRRSAYMEHGVGLQLPGDAGLAAIQRADVILAPNEFIAGFYNEQLPAVPVEVIGTPKLDELVAIPRESTSVLTVAVAFHWTSMTRLRPRPTEMFELAARENVRVIGHGHPRVWNELREWYEAHGIQPVERFEAVVRIADVFACDHSSTIYEWAALGRPVVLLDVPPTVKRSSGLRYTEHVDVGAHADPENLLEVLAQVVVDGPPAAAARATEELFPYRGRATERAIAVLRSHDAA